MKFFFCECRYILRFSIMHQITLLHNNNKLTDDNEESNSRLFVSRKQIVFFAIRYFDSSSNDLYLPLNHHIHTLNRCSHQFFTSLRSLLARTLTCFFSRFRQVLPSPRRSAIRSMNQESGSEYIRIEIGSNPIGLELNQTRLD